MYNFVDAVLSSLYPYSIKAGSIYQTFSLVCVSATQSSIIQRAQVSSEYENTAFIYIAFCILSLSLMTF